MPLVATANVLDSLARPQAAEALVAVLQRRPHLVGLQEWGISRRALLRRDPSFGWVAPAYGGNPVGFLRERYILRGHRLHRVGLVSLAEPGVRPVRVLPPRVATVVRLHDRLADRAVTVVNYHLVPGVQSSGHYRDDRPLLVARHRSEVRHVADLVGSRLESGDVVYAMGDSNFDGLELPGLTSAWDGRRDDPVGTLGSSRKIDDVFGPGPATDVTLLRSSSDHAAVLVARPD